MPTLQESHPLDQFLSPHSFVRQPLPASLCIDNAPVLNGSKWKLSEGLYSSVVRNCFLTLPPVSTFQLPTLGP